MKIDYSNRIFGLDVMRALAILFVVGSHALWVFPSQDSAVFSLLRLAGVMGVEIFFVLSGFLIGRILLRLFTNPDFSSKDVLYFLTRRWFRTFPNYYLILLINILIVIYIGRALPESLPLYFGFLQNGFSGMDIFFTESWSLPIEEVAYIIGPVLLYLVLLPKWKLSKKYLFLLVTLVIILFFLGMKVGYHVEHGATTLEFWNIELKAVVLYRIDAIYYGVLAAFISENLEKTWKKYRMELFFLSLFFFALLHIAIAAFGWGATTTPLFLNVLYLPLCSICIAGTLPMFSLWRKAPRLIVKPLTFMSLISYAMYLLHYSIILQLMHYLIDVKNGTFYTVIFSVGYLTITIALSTLLYVFYEKPMMDIRDRDFVKKLIYRN